MSKGLVRENKTCRTWSVVLYLLALKPRALVLNIVYYLIFPTGCRKENLSVDFFVNVHGRFNTYLIYSSILDLLKNDLGM